MEQKSKTWQDNADILTEEMEEYAKNYKCKKCDEYYCSHMLKARAQKFKQRMDDEFSEIISIAST